MDKLTYSVDKFSDDRCRVEVGISGMTLGVLYFEKPKRGWGNKPIVYNDWVCIDGDVQGLYEYGGEDITPKDIIRRCQEIIKGSL